MRKAYLLLENGFCQEGFCFGAEGEAIGEVVFNTSLTGYQEILTDPSYKGQIVCMSYPLIGNYGVNSQDIESARIEVEAFIIKEKSKLVSNFRAEEPLEEYLARHNVVGIEGVDTRALTRQLRIKGSMKGIVSSVDFDLRSLKAKLDVYPSIVGRDLVQYVSTSEIFEWEEEVEEEVLDERISKRYTIVVIDCGVKFSILRNLKRYFQKVLVIPYTTDFNQILKLKPQGVLFSNGPGDPQPVRPAIELASEFIERLRRKELKLGIMGICLGHQIIGLALGAKIYKLKFGHHGGNHPVKELAQARIDITAQNHNFCVDIEEVPDKEVELTHINLYDNTPEGLRHRSLPVFSVQFHPEAGPGPLDARYIFGKFRKLVEEVVER